MDFKYTSEVEEELDKIAKGEIKWDIVVSELYKNMMSKVQNISAEPKKKTGSSYERQLKGLGMYNNKNVYIFQGKNGIAEFRNQYPEARTFTLGINTTF